MLFKEESGGADATTMARSLEAEARSCCPCGITRLTCLVQAFFNAGFDKMCTSITAFEFFVHPQGALAGIPSCRCLCLCRIHNLANVGQKAGSAGVDKNSICTSWRPGFF